MTRPMLRIDLINLGRFRLFLALDDGFGRVAAARRALLRTNIGRLPSNTQPRARDTANDVSPESASQVDVQKTSEPLVEPQPYR